jgi:hypothetical protein
MRLGELAGKDYCFVVRPTMNLGIMPPPVYADALPRNVTFHKHASAIQRLCPGPITGAALCAHHQRQLIERSGRPTRARRHRWSALA